MTFSHFLNNFRYLLRNKAIDLLTQVKEVSFEECAADALVTETASVPVRYINLAALRKTKAATNRPQDVQDLENLPPA